MHRHKYQGPWVIRRMSKMRTGRGDVFRWHAVPVGSDAWGRALCHAVPSGLSEGWVGEGEEVTCPVCRTRTGGLNKKE